MSHHWVGDRVAITDVRRVIKNVVLEQDDLSWGPNQTFQFPKRGGTGAVWKSVARLIGDNHFRFHSPVESIDTQKRVARCADGREFGYETLISRLPLDVSTRMLSPAQPALSEPASRLKYST